MGFGQVASISNFGDSAAATGPATANAAKPANAIAKPKRATKSLPSFSAVERIRRTLA
jgi:hypothetical protein